MVIFSLNTGLAFLFFFVHTGLGSGSVGATLFSYMADEFSMVGGQHTPPPTDKRDARNTSVIERQPTDSL